MENNSGNQGVNVIQYKIFMSQTTEKEWHTLQEEQEKVHPRS